MIKLQRIERGLSQQELADKLEVDRQYVSKLETGKINMTLDYLDKVIKKLGSTPEDFHGAL